VGNEAQIIRELSSPRHSQSAARMAQAGNGQSTATASRTNREMPLDEDMPSLLEIGRRAALKAEYEVIDRVLQQTKWNRRQAAKMLKVSYKAFLNKLKAMEEEKESPA
jgi:two-component system response regulator AtoC